MIIYQLLPRLLTNRTQTNKPNGTLAENGCGKFNDITTPILNQIKKLGTTHVWFTGVLRHATCTDYSAYGIPRQHPDVVKGQAGSPYAICDYYDVDPDLAVNVEHRIAEWLKLIQRTHRAGMKVVMDFVPNHVARQYKSVAQPLLTRDFGQDDNTQMHFSPQNNFYYCVNQPLRLNFMAEGKQQYEEMPAKATGNDHFDNAPGRNDWYETVKLNYGIDYCDAGGRSTHFDPMPDTWRKMTDILCFWAAQGADAFRCDMAEMVPPEFWAYATKEVKQLYPHVEFIGEVYNPSLYRTYIESGFDYLYDKVGMYDCLRDVICQRRPAADITRQWQATDGINNHMLYFLENHDEQRIASPFFCGDAQRAIPALLVSALLMPNPVMIYAGQEYGEPAADAEGFSGLDGRTTIFDYWNVPTLYRAFSARSQLTKAERELAHQYTLILNIAATEKAAAEGQFFDLMYVNPKSADFDPQRHYAFLRKKDEELLIVVANFSDAEETVGVRIPAHAFDFLGIAEQDVKAVNLLHKGAQKIQLQRDGVVPMKLQPHSGAIYKIELKMEENDYLLNEHNKEEFPPAHTAEHLLNQLMVRMFGCERSRNAHIERKKSKISYILDHKPDRKEEREIERRMNELIEADMPVTYEFVTRDQIPADVKLDRLPEDASETIRLVRIGDFDVCPCIGKHVRSTAQIGKFVLLGTNWDEEKRTFRIRFKIV